MFSIKTVIVLLSILCADLSAAASESLLPFTGEMTQPYREIDEFFTQLRRNNTAYVVKNFGKQMHLRYGGDITWFHILVAMEHFHGHNPRAIMDGFAQEKKKFGYPIVIKDRTICESGVQAHYTYPQANVNHPDFYYLCTGRQRERHTPLKLMRTPLELAIAYQCIKTLCAIDAHTNTPVAHMKSFFIGDRQRDFDLAERVVARELWRQPCGNIGIADDIAVPVMQNFGTKGLLLLSRYHIDLFSTDPAFPDRPTLFARFEQMHPDKVHQVEYLKPKSFFAAIKEWWNSNASTASGFESSLEEV